MFPFLDLKEQLAGSSFSMNSYLKKMKISNLRIFCVADCLYVFVEIFQV